MGLRLKTLTGTLDFDLAMPDDANESMICCLARIFSGVNKDTNRFFKFFISNLFSYVIENQKSFVAGN